MKLPLLLSLCLCTHVMATSFKEIVLTGQANALELPGDSSCLLQQIHEQFLGAPITEETIEAIKQKIIHYYREEGYPVVAVYTPEQEVTSGSVTFVVVEGRVGEVRVVGNCHFPDCRYVNAIRLCPGDRICSAQLMEDVVWINRNPFRHADVILKPGTCEGTTDVDLLVCDRMPLRIYAGLDNTGVRATGTLRPFAGFTWANAFGWDQTLSYQLTTSTHFSRLQSHFVHYTIPLSCMRHVVTLFGGYNRVRPHISQFHSHGNSGQASLRYGIQELTFGLDYKNTNNNLEFVNGPERLDVISNEVNLTQLMASYGLAGEGCSHSWRFQLEAFVSPFECLPHQSNHAYNNLRPHAKVQYIYGRLLASDEYSFCSGWRLWGNLQAQASSEPLLPSEEFGLGGYATVRGYREREVNADDALCANLELRTPHWSLLQLCHCCVRDDLTLLAFIDYGYGHILKPLPQEQDNPTLFSAGPGLRYTIGRYFSLRCDVGYRFTSTQFSDEGWRTHFGLLLSY